MALTHDTACEVRCFWSNGGAFAAVARHAHHDAGDRPAVIVDCGCRGGQQIRTSIVESVDAWLDGWDVKAICLTHWDSDHANLVEAILRRCPPNSRLDLFCPGTTPGAKALCFWPLVRAACQNNLRLTLHCFYERPRGAADEPAKPALPERTPFIKPVLLSAGESFAITDRCMLTQPSRFRPEVVAVFLNPENVAYIATVPSTGEASRLSRRAFVFPGDLHGNMATAISALFRAFSSRRLTLGGFMVPHHGLTSANPTDLVSLWKLLRTGEGEATAAQAFHFVISCGLGKEQYPATPKAVLDLVRAGGLPMCLGSNVVCDHLTSRGSVDRVDAGGLASHGPCFDSVIKFVLSGNETTVDPLPAECELRSRVLYGRSLSRGQMRESTRLREPIHAVVRKKNGKAAESSWDVAVYDISVDGLKIVPGLPDVLEADEVSVELRMEGRKSDVQMKGWVKARSRTGRQTPPRWTVITFGGPPTWRGHT